MESNWWRRPKTVSAFRRTYRRSRRSCVSRGDRSALWNDCCDGRQVRLIQFIGSPHAPARRGEVLRRDLREADQLVPMDVARIASDEVRDVRIFQPSLGDLEEVSPQPLRLLEPHDPVPIGGAEALGSETFQESGGDRRVVAWIERPPEGRQESIGPIAG